MPKTRPPYPAAFRQQMIELVAAGNTPAQLARQFDCTAQTISNWWDMPPWTAASPRQARKG